MSGIENDTARLMVPSLFWLEVGSILARAPDLTQEGAMDGLLRLEALGIETVEIGRLMRLRALQGARERGLTMYDAAYLAVAEATGAPLATLDRQVEGVAAAMGLGRRGDATAVSEPIEPYGARQVDRISLAAIGAALAEMRKRYQADSAARQS